MNIKPTLRYADELSLDEIFVAKKASEWITAARGTPVPKMLFGEFWIEGELAVLAAGSDAGKSVLAVQIAESIARGNVIAPMNMTAKPQKILYLDLKLSSKQFEMRYAAEHDDEEGEFLKRPHKFAANFHRVEIDLHAKLPDGFRTVDQVLPHLIERLVAKYKARVVIIDNISYLQRSVYGYREIHSVMKELNSLKKRLGISILALARTSNGWGSQTAGGALFSRFADSVFTIGHSKLDPATRYIRHLTAHSTDKIYDASHVASFRMTRLNGNFLGFVHEAFSPENAHLEGVQDRRDWPTIQKIKEMTDKGMSIRQIATGLELPKTTVHRYLQMWVPPEPPPETVVENDDKPDDSYYFPGHEEYDAALNDPRYDFMIFDEDETDEDDDAEREENELLRVEYMYLEFVRTDASEDYEKTGKAPRLVESLGQLLESRDPEEIEDRAAIQRILDRIRGRDAAATEAEAVAEEADTSLDEGQAVNKSTVADVPEDSVPVPGTKLSYDYYGEKIFVEKEDERGKPVIWYKYDKKHKLLRKERDCNGISVTRVNTE